MSSTRTMCTATNPAIQAPRFHEEMLTRLTKPRRVGSGGHAGREQSHAPPGRRRRALRPAPEVALVPLGPRRASGKLTPRRLRGTRGPRAGAGPTSQAEARPAPSAGGRAGPAVPASAASCVASVAARRPSARFLRGVRAPGGPRAACAPLARRLAESWHEGNWVATGFSAVSKPNFASKYAFESAHRDLHNALFCTDLKSHFFFKKMSKINEHFAKF